MKRIYTLILTFFLFFTSFLHAAQDKPLRIAVDTFTPPFILEGANSQLFGFDISMMKYICQEIGRTCVFVPTEFDNIFTSIETNKVDAAVSALTITAERANRVLFSLPYLLSHARFLGPRELAQKSFGLGLLNNRSIGIEEGTIFPQLINSLGVRDPKIVTFSDAPALIDALQTGKVDVVLMDDPSAMYWQSQSSGRLSVLGEPLNYGFGLGIAVNRNNVELLNAINKALLKFQNSPEFKREFSKYIAHF
ncbi:transporter substrate-binding domain-containing protein [Legionella hackeliae]|uniref:Putative amino acid ABC transporter, periplasmic binding protein n=1 Tax=Legionella hackeliae TaxID=449 RepID=A0A0A8UUZ1_LEGHA|nr:transporter substrate-binding domain-containing protein [Legionella hackeliae]KTD15296.1 putative amino acid ABC transporter, periplasmic binding protein [Legionella hackeliae]CEK11336.1 putative amino acid ABC transporter, periplasmic binding protein [Legionella hackeliae]STX48108.1 putative amino acid ABC transporter, periplasmic binding protein [Legionella hackeliae]